jgi:serine/threonine protein kinase
MSYGPFNTDSERVYVIEDIRKPEIIFPSGWPTNRHRQKSIITWLLQHDPAKRPTALELSQSSLIPAPVEDENVKRALGMICKNKTLLIGPSINGVSSETGLAALPVCLAEALRAAHRSVSKLHLRLAGRCA